MCSQSMTSTTLIEQSVNIQRAAYSYLTLAERNPFVSINEESFANFNSICKAVLAMHIYQYMQEYKEFLNGDCSIRDLLDIHRQISVL